MHAGDVDAKKKLLIVEDDIDIREALDGLLRTEGYDVAACSNGLEALQYLRNSPPPDAILLDLTMPVMDGWQFRVEQKRDPSLAPIPVVALSADATPKAAAIDAEVYLKKPVDYDTLIATIDRLVLRLEHQKLQARLAQTDRLTSLGTLAAGIAHEINNPLAYVLLNLSFVADELPLLLKQCRRGGGEGIIDHEEQVTGAIEHAREGADRIRSIVRGLKTFSRPEDESLSPIDVRRVMESSVSMITNEIRHRARLVHEHQDVPLVIANEARLGQVFLNLLLNAVQALPAGAAATSEIRTVVRKAAQTVVIEVHDTGSGIPAEIRGRIFEPFFTTKPVGIGTGLGLAICHGIVTSLGGKLSVESEVGRGSIFSVEIPAMAEEEPSSSHRATVPTPLATTKRGRVLVVDDEPIICFTLERLLSEEHDVVALTSASAALSRISRGERFDLVLCDLMMPAMDGEDLFREVSRVAPEVAERMVFLTGGAFTARSQAFLEKVENARIEKPFEVDLLLRLIRDRVHASV